MKKYFPILLCLCFIVPVRAQEGLMLKNEINVTYGQFTAPQMLYVLGEVFGAAFSLGHFQADNTVFLGALGLEYFRSTNDWFAYGASLLLDYSTSDSYSVDKDGNKTLNGKYNLGWASMMPSVKFKWLRREKITLYSKLSAGPGMIFSNEGSLMDKLSVSFQATPIGLAVGKGSIRGFAEIGFGMQGIVNVGVQKRF
ncbi:MAG: hypothetical protein J6T94_05865 [Bacteroidaceae bacterium]|nr:hypothetical protein [Bacteroidaceae bacterium]